jgi:hypothetical protein
MHLDEDDPAVTRLEERLECVRVSLIEMSFQKKDSSGAGSLRVYDPRRAWQCAALRGY